MALRHPHFSALPPMVPFVSDSMREINDVCAAVLAQQLTDLHDDEDDPDDTLSEEDLESVAGGYRPCSASSPGQFELVSP